MRKNRRPSVMPAISWIRHARYLGRLKAAPASRENITTPFRTDLTLYWLTPGRRGFLPVKFKNYHLFRDS